MWKGAANLSTSGAGYCLVSSGSGQSVAAHSIQRKLGGETRSCGPVAARRWQERNKRDWAKTLGPQLSGKFFVAALSDDQDRLHMLYCCLIRRYQSSNMDHVYLRALGHIQFVMGDHAKSVDYRPVAGARNARRKGKAIRSKLFQRRHNLPNLRQCINCR